jgi:hypothetical protein
MTSLVVGDLILEYLISSVNPPQVSRLQTWHLCITSMHFVSMCVMQWHKLEFWTGWNHIIPTYYNRIRAQRGPKRQGLSHWIQLLEVFTLLKPVSYEVNRFLCWKCLDRLDWNGLFWCPVERVGRCTTSYLLAGRVCLWCFVFYLVIPNHVLSPCYACSGHVMGINKGMQHVNEHVMCLLQHS